MGPARRHLAPISNRPTLAEDDWKPYGRKITKLAEKMADFGVGMAFHHHMGTIVETDREVDRLMSETGYAVGLLFDSGHCAFSGGDPVALSTRHLGRIDHVHCKDVRPAMLRKARETNMSFMAAVMEGIFTVPGDGSLDYRDDPQPLRNAAMPAGWSSRPNRTPPRRIP